MPISNSYMYIWRIIFAVSSLKLEIVSFVLLLAQTCNNRHRTKVSLI